MTTQFSQQVRVNHHAHAKYLGQSFFNSKVTVQTHRQTHVHIGLRVLS